MLLISCSQPVVSSVMVTLYNPAVNPEISCVVSPVLHKKEKLPIRPMLSIEIAPSESPQEDVGVGVAANVGLPLTVTSTESITSHPKGPVLVTRYKKSPGTFVAIVCCLVVPACTPFIVHAKELPPEPESNLFGVSPWHKIKFGPSSTSGTVNSMVVA